MSSIVVAPFSNSDIRDWPVEHYAALVRDLAERWDEDGRIRVVGTASQKLRACDIVRDCDPSRVSNDCGTMDWPMLERSIRSAACVIGNNSGLAHLAGSLRVPTVCVFGGSHQRLEWRPMGFTVVLLSRSIACSPCHLDHGASCLYDKACLRQIEPSLVADTVLALVSEPHRRGGGALPSEPRSSLALHQDGA